MDNRAITETGYALRTDAGGAKENPMDDLIGKVALVTGASRGIGRAIALALANAGANIAINYRNRDDEAKEVLLQIRRSGRLAVAVKADVSISADVARMIGIIERELGSPSILVNNAGIG